MLSVLSARLRLRGWAQPARIGTDRLATFGTVAAAIAAVAYVARFATNCPVGDEWQLLAEIFRGGGGFPWSWIAAHHNEHRYILAKFVWYGSLALSNFDFRAGMFVTVGLLAASAGLLLAALRHLGVRRGPADLLVPALLLHWGHWFGWLMGYQIAFTAVVLCAAGFAWAVSQAAESPRRAAWLASAFALLMPLNGGFGIGWSGPMCAWLVYAAWRLRSPALLVVPALAAGYLAFVVFTTPPPIASQAKPDAATFVESCVMYLATGFGPIAFGPWGAGRIVASALALGLFAAATLGTLRALRDPAERLRAAGLLAAILGHLAVTVSIAMYRGTAQGTRFITPSAVGLLIAWLALRRYVPMSGRAFTIAAVLCAVAIFAINVRDAYREGLRLRSGQKAFLADVEKQTPALYLAGKFGGRWTILDPFGQNIAALRDAKVGPYARLAPDPHYKSIPISLPSDAMIRPCDNAPFERGDRTAPTFDFGDSPGPALALRVRVEQTRVEVWQAVRLYWFEDGNPVEQFETAYPVQFPANQGDMVFRIDARARRARLEAASPTGGLLLCKAEWLVAAP